jgi:hypothetical protein
MLGGTPSLRLLNVGQLGGRFLFRPSVGVIRTPAQLPTLVRDGFLRRDLRVIVKMMEVAAQVALAAPAQGGLGLGAGTQVFVKTGIPTVGKVMEIRMDHPLIHQFLAPDPLQVRHIKNGCGGI